jgi:hypothetical protein
MELDFQPRHQIVALLGQRCEALAQDVARAERHWPAIGIKNVAQHPAGVRCPGQHAEGAGIWQHHHFGRALELLHPEAAARRPYRNTVR